MNFPTMVTITATNLSTGSPVANAAFVLTLKAARKNDYSVGPVITNTSGIAEITKLDCEKAITRAQAMFLMDYAGDLASCRPAVELKLHAPDAIRNMIQQIESDPKFWGSGFDDPSSLVKSLRSVTNVNFAPVSIVLNETELLKNPTIVVRMTEVKLFTLERNTELP